MDVQDGANVDGKVLGDDRLSLCQELCGGFPYA